MDDDKNKDLARNNLVFVLLMTVGLILYFQYMMPAPGKKTPPAQKAPVQQKEPAKEAAPAAPAQTPAEAPVPLEGLPEIPAESDPADDEAVLEDQDLHLVFTRIGGRLKQAEVLVGKDHKEAVRLVPVDAAPDTKVVYPMGLRFTDPQLGDNLDWRRFDVEKDPAGKALTFSLTIPGHAAVRKRFALGSRSRVLEMQVEYQNLDAKPQVVGIDLTPAYYVNWGPNITSGDQLLGLKQSLVWRTNNRIEELSTAGMKPPQPNEPFEKPVPGAEWVGVKSAYFVVAFKPEFTGGAGWALGNPTRFRFGLSVPRFEVAPNAVQSSAFSIYMGPSEQKALAGGWDTLPQVLRFFQPPWGIMDWFAKLCLRILNGFYSYVPNYGLAIIFLTILVRLAIYPLTLKSMKSMKKMQMLAPEIEELKAKYPDDQQEMQRRMMELYKERGVNPVGGCFPILLQMPILIAFYRMLWCAYELRGAPFLWMTDLSQPDHLFHMPWMSAVPYVGHTFQYFNVLPFLMALVMFLNQKLMPMSGPAQSPEQKMIMNIMPVFFSFICYNMAAGLNLYILTSTLLGMAQQKLTRVGVDATKPKKTVGKGQHFYTAAKARQRQMARDLKKEKRQRLLAAHTGPKDQKWGGLESLRGWLESLRGGKENKDDGPDDERS